MAMDLSEFKCVAISILTSSKSPVTIEKFRKDYQALEGIKIPFESLGFKSDIELLQSMPDTFSLPPNPNASSILSQIVTDKSIHLKMLVDKQKPSKNRKSNSNGYCKMKNSNTNQYNKRSYSFQNSVNNNHRNNSQNKNYYSKSNTHYSHDNNNHRNQPSTSNSRVYLNQKYLNENGFHNSGIVTDRLRAYLEFNLSQNQKHLSKTKLEELVKSHEDFPALKTENMNDIFTKLENFLNINDTGVSLKNISQLKTKEHCPVVYQEYQESDKSSKLLKESEVNQSPHNNSHKNVLTKNGFNNYHINHSKQFARDQYNDKNVSCELKTKIKMNYNASNVVSDNNIETFLHKVEHIPEKVIFNIAKIFEAYYWGINVENFKLIYYVENYSTIDPSAYGFTSVVQMLKAFDEFIYIQNEIMYTKPKYAFFKLYQNIHFDNDELENQLNSILTKNSTLKISLDIYEKSPYFEYSRKCKMVLVEAYNPSLFYLQLETKIEELNKLMNNMLKFYETESSNYCVKPEEIIPGLIYASSYSSFLKKKQWHRIKILKEMDAMSVEVIHVDYGTVDNIPKTEIRFLHQTFSELPCQAIYCCLNGYNELDSITSEVSNAFLNIVDDKPVYVLVDKCFCLKSRHKIFHVTLFKSENYSDNNRKLKNINDELTIHHLQR